MFRSRVKISICLDSELLFVRRAWREVSVAFSRDWKWEEERRASVKEARSWRISEEEVG